MKYEKPQVVALASASAAIQYLNKGASLVPDSETTFLTSSAYEADE